MTPSSRTARKRKSVRKTETKGARKDAPTEGALTREQLEDCESFKKLFDELAQRHEEFDLERVTYNWLQAKTGVANTTWGAYYRAERPIAERHMNLLAILLKFRPQDRFKTYPYKDLVLIPPDRHIPRLYRSLSQLHEPERGEFMEAIRIALKASSKKRLRIVAAVREIVGEPDDNGLMIAKDEKAS